MKMPPKISVSIHLPSSSLYPVMLWQRVEQQATLPSAFASSDVSQSSHIMERCDGEKNINKEFTLPYSPWENASQPVAQTKYQLLAKKLQGYNFQTLGHNGGLKNYSPRQYPGLWHLRVGLTWSEDPSSCILVSLRGLNKKFMVRRMEFHWTLNFKRRSE